jgi:hypothetical protein
MRVKRGTIEQIHGDHSDSRDGFYYHRYTIPQESVVHTLPINRLLLHKVINLFTNQSSGTPLIREHE